MSQSPKGVQSTMTPQGHGRPRGKDRPPKLRQTGGFIPTDRQVQVAQGLIIRALKQGVLYACNAKEAVHRLLDRMGKGAHKLGKTIGQKSTAVHRGLMDLMGLHRVRCNGICFRLT